MIARLLLSMVVIACGAPAAELAIQSAAAPVGATVDVAVRYESAGSEVTGLQFDLQFNQKNIAVTAKAGPVTSAAGKNLISSDVGVGRKRFVIAMKSICEWLMVRGSRPFTRC